METKAVMEGKEMGAGIVYIEWEGEEEWNWSDIALQMLIPSGLWKRGIFL